MHPAQKKLQKQIKAGSTNERASHCWVWKRQISGDGRGIITLSDRNGSFTESACRISYQAFVGPLKRDQVVHQTCGNPLCVNPDHLVLDEGKREHEHERLARGA